MNVLQQLDITKYLTIPSSRFKIRKQLRHFYATHVVKAKPEEDSEIENAGDVLENDELKKDVDEEKDGEGVESIIMSTLADGDNPELELDMWGGQFSLSRSFSMSWDHIYGMRDSMEDLLNNNFLNNWRTDSSVTCAMVPQKMQGVCKSEMNLAPDRQFEKIKQEIVALMSKNRSLEKKLVQNNNRNSKERIEIENTKYEMFNLKKQIFILNEEKSCLKKKLLEARSEMVNTQEGHEELKEAYRNIQEKWNQELIENKDIIEKLTSEVEELRRFKKEQQIEVSVEKSIREEVMDALPAVILDKSGDLREYNEVDEDYEYDGDFEF